MSRRGLSLSETVVALFLLLVAAAIFFTLLNRTLHYQSRSRTQMLATWAAQRRLAQLQSGARGLGAAFYSPASWAPLLAGPIADPDAPGVQLQAQVVDHVVDSPCSALESIFTAGSRRTVARGVKRLQITASWGSATTQRVVLYSLIGGPVPPIASLTVQQISGGSPVPPNGSIDLSAQAYDSGGQPVPDLVYLWYCKPISGSATVEPIDRAGRTGRLTHRIRRPDGSYISFGPDPLTGGPRRCKVRVRVRANGIDTWGESSEILLAP